MKKSQPTTSNQPRVLVIDDEESLTHMLSIVLHEEGFEATLCNGAVQALELLGDRAFDLILCDVKMPKMDGLAFLSETQKRGIDSTIIMMSAYGSKDSALEAIRQGAYDYIPKPFKNEDLLLTLRKAIERERLLAENRRLKKASRMERAVELLQSENPAMKKLVETLLHVADFKTPILITGESGTGKELVARALHQASARRNKEFVAVNCSAIPENLLESELFGHMRGAFTGAHMDKKGLFETADGGTLFLDEIGDMPPGLQAKLLRALQEEEIRRIGDQRTRNVDVRVLSATHRNLDALIAQQGFREDLLFRLNVVELHLPPLRERREDIPVLAQSFIGRCNEKHRRSIQGVDAEAMDLLRDFDWPGNVRQLENAVERAMLTAEGERLEKQDFIHMLPDTKKMTEPEFFGEELSIKKASRAVEKNLIQRALTQTGGNKTKAAKLLDISHKALLYKIKEYGVGG